MMKVIRYWFAIAKMMTFIEEIHIYMSNSEQLAMRTARVFGHSDEGHASLRLGRPQGMIHGVVERIAHRFARAAKHVGADVL